LKEIDASELEILEELGTGNFGVRETVLLPYLFHQHLSFFYAVQMALGSMLVILVEYPFCS